MKSRVQIAAANKLNIILCPILEPINIDPMDEFLANGPYHEVFKDIKKSCPGLYAMLAENHAYQENKEAIQKSELKKNRKQNEMQKKEKLKNEKAEQQRLQQEKLQQELNAKQEPKNSKKNANKTKKASSPILKNASTKTSPVSKEELLLKLAKSKARYKGGEVGQSAYESKVNTIAQLEKHKNKLQEIITEYENGDLIRKSRLEVLEKSLKVMQQFQAASENPNNPVYERNVEYDFLYNAQIYTEKLVKDILEKQKQSTDKDYVLQINGYISKCLDFFIFIIPSNAYDMNVVLAKLLNLYEASMKLFLELNEPIIQKIGDAFMGAFNHGVEIETKMVVISSIEETLVKNERLIAEFRIKHYENNALHYDQKLFKSKVSIPDANSTTALDVTHNMSNK